MRNEDVEIVYRDVRTEKEIARLRRKKKTKLNSSLWIIFCVDKAYINFMPLTRVELLFNP